MKFTGFSSGCIGKALTIILCIILGMVIAIGGAAMAGYLVLTQQGGVGKLSDTVNADPENPFLQFEDETKDMSLLQWGQEVMNAVKDMSSSEIGNLEKILGLSIISNTIEDAMGVDASLVKTSTFSNLGKTISSNLSLRNAKEKFGIAFPDDIPLFSDEEFLSKPLSEAFENFTDHKLNEFIVIGEDTHSILKELQDLAVNEISGRVGDEKINSLFVCEILTVNENSNSMLKALKYCCLESQYVDEEHTVYKTRKYTEIIDGVEVETEYPLIGINERMNTMLVSEAIDIDENSNIILRKISEQGLKITELGTERVTEIVDDTELREFVKIDDDSEPILKALKDTKISQLNEKLSTIRIDEIFDQEKLQSGALSLIPSDTLIGDIPNEMTNVVLNSTTAIMIGKGLITSDLEKLDDESKIDKEQKAFILNNSIGEMMEGLINFMADSYTVYMTEEVVTVHTNYHYVSPNTPAEPVSGEFNSISDFVATYTQFDSVIFNGNVVITVDETLDAKYLQNIDGTEVYCIPVFNGISDGNGSYTITFSETVKLAIYDYSEGVVQGISRNQFAYCYFKDITAIEGAFEYIGEVTTAQLKAAA